jgi:hypothetical protein
MSIARIALVFVGCFVLFARPAPAQFTGTKVVETGVPYPIGTFSSFSAPPSVSGSTIAFPGATAAGPGIFTATTGTPTAVATFATPVPGGSGNFTAFSAGPVGLSASGVAFGGNGAPGPPSNIGIYSNVTGSLAPVVTGATAYPGGGFFNGTSIPALSDTTAAFAGTNGGPGTWLGVFTKTGAGPLTVVANTSTAIPFGGGNFTAFNDPVNGPTVPNVSGSRVVFNGRGVSSFGVYTTATGTLTRVADNTIIAPGGTGAFTSFGFTPTINGTDVAFYGASSGRTGIYLSSGGGLSVVADTTTAVPGGSGNFTSFQSTGQALSGGGVVFQGTSASGTGIYFAQSGTIQKVVATGDVLDGNTINTVAISDFSYDGVNIAVRVGYTGGQAIYTFSAVPEPTGLVALGAAGLVAARLRRRRAGAA